MHYLLLFLTSFAAATFLPVSSEVHFFFLINNGFSFTLSILVATAGNTLGGMFTYYLGTLCKWEWIEKYLRIKRAKIEKTQLKVDKYGSVMALLCWLPVIGDVIAVGLGTLKVNWKIVFLFMLIGKMARYFFFGLFLEN